ncbi:MAG: Maf family protein [Pseudomonadota bacterium]
MTRLVLASKSASRRALLEGADVPFVAMGSDVDEDVIKTAEKAAGRTPAEIALALAKAKAMALAKDADDLVIGGDQVLDFQGVLYDKPKSLEEAKVRLLSMAGETHYLRGALCLAQAGKIVWSYEETSTLTMRPLSAARIDAYLSVVGTRVLRTVGAYELEGPGVRLFSEIEGDYFSILGLSLLPLLDELRQRNIIPW